MVQKISGIEKFYGNEGGVRECHNFRSKIFNLTIPENIVANPAVSPKNWFSPKSLCILEVNHDLPSEIFSLTVPKNFVGNPFVLHKICGMEKNYA